MAVSNLATKTFRPLLKTSTPSAPARLASCWEVYCAFGPYPRTHGVGIHLFIHSHTRQEIDQSQFNQILAASTQPHILKVDF